MEYENDRYSFEKRKGSISNFANKAFTESVLVLSNPPRKIGATNSGISRNEDLRVA